MSDVDSTAATQATPFSSIPDSYVPSSPSQSSSILGSRSPSPAGRPSKRSRVDSWFPEHGVHLNHNNNPTEVGGRSGRFQLSHSTQNLPNLRRPRRPSEAPRRKFLDHDREFISHILSTRGVMNRTMEVLQHHDNLPGIRNFLDHLPVISADNSCFCGWREKVDTWPMDDGRYSHRYFSFSH